MGLTTRISTAWKALRSDWPQISWDEYAQLVSMNGNVYLTGATQQTITGHQEEITANFAGLVQQAYRSNGIIFACMLARQQLFSQARFQFQQLRNGQPGDLFGTKDLAILERPWANGVTGDLLSRAIQDADLGGNSYFTRRSGSLRRLRPDWVSIVLGSMSDPSVEAGDIDAEVVGYIYHPGGKTDHRSPETLLANEVAHFAPIPDPLGSFRGMSWLTPVIREIGADQMMTDHKRQYLVNGATPNLTVAIDKDLKEAANPKAFAEWVDAFKRSNTNNQWDKYKTWYLAGGTTVTKVGSTMQEIDFRAVQGAGEVRICIASGVPAPIAGISEGMQGSALNEGIYNAAKRKFVDFTIRDLWGNFSASMETLVPAPSGSRLWYDDRFIPALAEDKKDLAQVQQMRMAAISTGITAGFEADAVIAAIEGNDLGLLSGKHTGLFSVQLQAPGSTKMPAGEVPGEVPVGKGTKPEVLAPGDTSTKPLTDTAGKPVVTPGRALRMLEALTSPEPPEVIE